MADTTPLMRSLTYQFEEARRVGDLATMKHISDLMRAEQERIDAGIPEPDPAHRVDLYENVEGNLYLVRPVPCGLAYDVTGIADPGDFAIAAETLLNDGTPDNAPVPSVPAAWLNHDDPELQRIALYSDETGAVEVLRDDTSGQPLARTAGRRYIGYLEEE